MISFACPACSMRFKGPDDAVGKRTSCTACGTKFTVRESQPSAAQPVIAVPCPTCSVEHQARADAVGQEMRCTCCGTKFKVAAAARPERPALRKHKEGPPIRLTCPVCGEAWDVPATLAGKRVFCRRCDEHCRVPGEEVREAEPPKAPAQSWGERALLAIDEALSPVLDYHPPKVRPVRLPFALFPSAVGVVLLIWALVVHLQLNEADARQDRLESAAISLDYHLAQLTGRYPDKPAERKRSDRTWVYVLALVGAFFLGVGCVCWVIERQGPSV